jgi:F0F1-type ATP synthase membrane subunit b/b'
VCWLAAIVRASVHYCTPVPGGGVGCRFEDMQLAASEVNLLMEKAKVEMEKAKVEMEKGMEKAKVDINKGMEKAKVEMEKAKVEMEKGMEKAKVDINKGLDQLQDGIQRVRKNTGAPILVPLFTKTMPQNEDGAGLDTSAADGMVTQQPAPYEQGIGGGLVDAKTPTKVEELGFVVSDEHLIKGGRNQDSSTSDSTLKQGMINNEIGP